MKTVSAKAGLSHIDSTQITTHVSNGCDNQDVEVIDEQYGSGEDYGWYECHELHSAEVWNLKLTNSTIAGNQAAATGGGIFNHNPDASGPSDVRLAFTTIAFNDGDTDSAGGDIGGGIFEGMNASYSDVHGSLIALNEAATEPDCTASATSTGHNLLGVESTGCTGFDKPSDLTVADPMLGVLGPHGGLTETIPSCSARRRSTPAAARAHRPTSAASRDRRDRATTSARSSDVRSREIAGVCSGAVSGPAPSGQRDRPEIYETEGHRFESCRARSF